NLCILLPSLSFPYTTLFRSLHLDARRQFTLRQLRPLASLRNQLAECLHVGLLCSVPPAKGYYRACMQMSPTPEPQIERQTPFLRSEEQRLNSSHGSISYAVF